MDAHSSRQKKKTRARSPGTSTLSGAEDRACKNRMGKVKRRIKFLALQCGNPEELIICKVLENKSISDEYELHRRFSKFRIRGEWFSAEVLDLKDV